MMQQEARHSTSREVSASGLQYLDRLGTFECQAFQRVAGLNIPKCLTLYNIAGLKTSLCVTLAVFAIDFLTIKNNLFEESKCAIYLRITSGIRDQTEQSKNICWDTKDMTSRSPTNPNLDFITKCSENWSFYPIFDVFNKK